MVPQVVPLLFVAWRRQKYSVDVVRPVMVACSVAPEVPEPTQTQAVQVPRAAVGP
jgi:hypothetical protein